MLKITDIITSANCDMVCLRVTDFAGDDDLRSHLTLVLKLTSFHYILSSITLAISQPLCTITNHPYMTCGMEWKGDLGPVWIIWKDLCSKVTSTVTILKTYCCGTCCVGNIEVVLKRWMKAWRLASLWWPLSVTISGYLTLNFDLESDNLWHKHVVKDTLHEPTPMGRCVGPVMGDTVGPCSAGAVTGHSTADWWWASDSSSTKWADPKGWWVGSARVAWPLVHLRDAVYLWLYSQICINILSRCRTSYSRLIISCSHR